MEVSPNAFDSSKPFAGVVVCCTSIPPDQRTEIASRTNDLGGSHTYDLTPAVTHLIVGEYDTPKYRHVAKERPDIKPMASGWIDAVRTLWMQDKEVDFEQLEFQWKLRTFETSGGQKEEERGQLLCCLTGFEDVDRQFIEKTVTANGGRYTGDLSRKVTHLIVAKPEGKKYQAAKNWNIRTVSIEWLKHSVERGMILDEECYDPVLPQEERGKGAIVVKEDRRIALGKRSRDGSVAVAVNDTRQRKLRKTASLKFSNESQNLWGDILIRKPSMDLSRPDGLQRAATVTPTVAPGDTADTAVVESVPTPSTEHTQVAGGVFDSCRFFMHGFPPMREKVVQDHLISHGGQISPSLADVAASLHPEPADQRFLIIPQTSQPDTHPTLPHGVHIVTQFYIERCIHNKQLLHPNEHVLGRPFPKFPIDGFEHLTICTAGFRNEQLNQVEKTITQLGAKYSERLNSTSSVLVCPSTEGVRKQKLDFALFAKVPVVKADWLWHCISSACAIPWDTYLFEELKQRISIDVDPDLEKERQKLQRTRSEPMFKKNPKAAFRAPSAKAGVDKTAFEKEEVAAPVQQEASAAQRKETNESHESDHETAPTHQTDDSFDKAPGSEPAPAPLSEVSANVLNKSPSPPKTDQPRRKPFRRFPTGGTVGDSDAGDESDTTATQPEKEEGPSGEDAEALRKRKIEEEKAAERQAMARRLTSLIDAEATGQDGKKSPDSTTAARPPRRNRGVIGRAVSNISNTSSASGCDSSSHNATTGSMPIKQPITTSWTAGIDRIKSAPGALGALDGLLDGPAASEETESQLPSHPSTQIGYDDPKARQQREAVMDRMMGNNKKPPSSNSGSGSGNRKSQERPTMRGLDEAGQTRKTRRR